MLKYTLLAGVMFVSAPVLAQQGSTQANEPATQGQSTPSSDTDEPTTTPASPADPATPASPADPAAPNGAASTPAQPAQPAIPAEPGGSAPDRTAQTRQSVPAQQPATAAQIATVVDQGFPTYDKDADGNLKSEEFGAWMVSLRSASEPAFTGKSAADKAWIGKALAQADTDKSGSVNKEEIKGFLAPAAS